MKREGWLILGAILVVGGLSAGGPTVCVLPTLAPQARALAMAAGAQRPFEEVAGDLRSEDPKVRIAGMRALAASSYLEAMAPIASLLTDPIDEVQLEAIDTLLSFVVVDRVATKRRVALVVEVRDKQRPEAVFEMGPFGTDDHLLLVVDPELEIAPVFLTGKPHLEPGDTPTESFLHGGPPALGTAVRVCEQATVSVLVVLLVALEHDEAP